MGLDYCTVTTTTMTTSPKSFNFAHLRRPFFSSVKRPYYLVIYYFFWCEIRIECVMCFFEFFSRKTGETEGVEGRYWWGTYRVIFTLIKFGIMLMFESKTCPTEMMTLG